MAVGKAPRDMNTPLGPANERTRRAAESAWLPLWIDPRHVIGRKATKIQVTQELAPRSSYYCRSVSRPTKTQRRSFKSNQARRFPPKRSAWATGETAAGQLRGGSCVTQRERHPGHASILQDSERFEKSVAAACVTVEKSGAVDNRESKRHTSWR